MMSRTGATVNGTSSDIRGSARAHTQSNIACLVTVIDRERNDISLSTDHNCSEHMIGHAQNHDGNSIKDARESDWLLPDNNDMEDRQSESQSLIFGNEQLCAKY